MIICTVVFTYGLFILIKGIFDFKKAQSKIDIFTRSLYGFGLMLNARNIYHGDPGTVLVSSLLAFVIGIQFLLFWMKKGRLMTDLIVAVLSFAVCVAILLQLLFNRS